MNFLESVLKYLFPPICGMCGQIGVYLCPKCKRQIEYSNLFLNQNKDYTNNYERYFDYHYYLFSYTGLIREKIIQYKFYNQPYLADMFSEFFVKNEKLCGFLKNYDIIVPVPISRQRVAMRGYNQSELIVGKMSKSQGIKSEKNVLVKIKENKTQSLLDKTQRIENVKNVYKIQNGQKIKEKNILLFDDIYTTGSTANECAKVLKYAGASSVGILTIAKDF